MVSEISHTCMKSLANNVTHVTRRLNERHRQFLLRELLKRLGVWKETGGVSYVVAFLQCQP